MFKYKYIQFINEPLWNYFYLPKLLYKLNIVKITHGTVLFKNKFYFNLILFPNYL